MKTVEFQPPADLAPTQQLTADEAAQQILDSDFEYWQQGGNGEGVLSFVGGNTSLLIKQTLRDGFLLTMQTNDDQRTPCSGAGFDEFTWDERGGDPFKVPLSCLVSTATAAEIVRFYASCGGESDAVSWISWFDLPRHYFPE
jgi:hypothetical protein